MMYARSIQPLSTVTNMLHAGYNSQFGRRNFSACRSRRQASKRPGIFNSFVNKFLLHFVHGFVEFGDFYEQPSFAVFGWVALLIGCGLHPAVAAVDFDKGLTGITNPDSIVLAKRCISLSTSTWMVFGPRT